MSSLVSYFHQIKKYINIVFVRPATSIKLNLLVCVLRNDYNYITLGT